MKITWLLLVLFLLLTFLVFPLLFDPIYLQEKNGTKGPQMFSRHSVLKLSSYGISS